MFAYENADHFTHEIPYYENQDSHIICYTRRHVNVSNNFLTVTYDKQESRAVAGNPRDAAVIFDP